MIAYLCLHVNVYNLHNKYTLTLFILSIALYTLTCYHIFTTKEHRDTRQATGREGKKMVKTIHVKNVSMIWTEEYDIVLEWDESGRIVRQERADYQRYRTSI